MNWPIWLPRLAIMSSVARLTGRASRLKNSRTPRQSPWSRIGTAKAACRPAPTAAERRRNSGSSAMSAIHWGAASAQTRPGRRTPRSMATSRVMAANPERSGTGRLQSVAHRSRCVRMSSRQNTPRSQSRLVPIVSRIFGPACPSESASASTRVVSYWAASRRSAFLRRVTSWKTTTPPSVVPPSSRSGRPVTVIQVPSSRLG